MSDWSLRRDFDEFPALASTEEGQTTKHAQYNIHRICKTPSSSAQEVLFAAAWS